MAFSTNGAAGNEGLSCEINVTPLIDVLLVMLIIFMVVVPAIPRGLNSTLPSAAARRAADEAADRPILVQVELVGEKQGQIAVRYLIDGVGVEAAKTQPRLQELLSRRETRQVLLKADGRLDFGVIAGVIDMGKRAGAESVGLLTRGTDNQRDRPIRSW